MPLNPAWVALSLVEGLGGVRFRALLTAFAADPSAVLQASDSALRAVSGIGVKLSAAIRAVDLAAVEAAVPRWEAQGVRLIGWDDPSYPTLLKAIGDAPPTLFVRGMWGVFPKSIAIVGTRRPSPEARAAAESLGYSLAERGIVVVSGLAFGVDSAAHYGALAQPKGRTLAVLGGGVLRVYPPQNSGLADAICGRGALISETHPFAEPKPSSLVARNRIISGLCQAVIVVETGADGGAMYAARRAFEQGRSVYVVDSPASGNQTLLAEGARLLNAHALETLV